MESEWIDIHNMLDVWEVLYNCFLFLLSEKISRSFTIKGQDLVDSVAGGRYCYADFEVLTGMYGNSVF